MALHEYAELEQGSEAWHDQRRGIVTASVVGRLLTSTGRVADNETSRTLTATLVAERITGYTEPSYMNDDMMRGVLHEPVARERYASHYGVEVTQTGFMVRDDWGYKIGASPDGLVGDDGGLEIKCPRAKSHIKTILANEVPGYYMAQVQACLLVSGRKWWDYVSFCGGLPLYVTRVLPDPQWRNAIFAAVERFEAAATEQIAAYGVASKNLAPTERVPDYNTVELSL